MRYMAKRTGRLTGPCWIGPMMCAGKFWQKAEARTCVDFAQNTGLPPPPSPAGGNP